MGNLDPHQHSIDFAYSSKNWMESILSSGWLAGEICDSGFTEGQAVERLLRF